jgi:uncharacterized protein YndB with AHSA1/START domain
MALAHVLVGRKVAFRTHQNKYLSAEQDGKVVADRPEAKQWEHFEVIAVDAKDHKNVVVNLKSHHGKFLCSDSGDKAVADRGEAKEWERWTIVEVGDGNVALRDYRGKYLCVEGEHKIVVNRDAAKAWESFHPVLQLSAEEQHAHSLFGKRVTFKAHNGKYLCAEQDGKLVADRADAKEWEHFTITPVHRFHPFSGVHIKSHHGKFLSSDNNVAVINRDAAREWEEWHIVGLSGGKVALKDYRGKYLCVEGAHKIVTDRDHAREWESLTVA